MRRRRRKRSPSSAWPAVSRARRTSTSSGATCATAWSRSPSSPTRSCWPPASIPPCSPNPRYVRARGVLDGVDLFDAALFGYSPREAEVLDPQQRVFLECAWEALETPATTPRASRGASASTPGRASAPTCCSNLLPQAPAGEVWQLVLANDKDSLTTRVSYKLDLRGPSVTVQTACSTSLVAVHLACQSLLD